MAQAVIQGLMLDMASILKVPLRLLRGDQVDEESARMFALIDEMYLARVKARKARELLRRTRAKKRTRRPQFATRR